MKQCVDVVLWNARCSREIYFRQQNRQNIARKHELFVFRLLLPVVNVCKMMHFLLIKLLDIFEAMNVLQGLNSIELFENESRNVNALPLQEDFN